MKIRIVRLSEWNGATFGQLLIDDKPEYRTLELPFKDNQKDISCIPAGVYVCKRENSPSFGMTFRVCDVPDRTHILFHHGNTTKDTHGCIILGLTFGIMEGEPAVFDSRKAMSRFLERLRDADTFNLKIVSAIN